MEEEELSDEDVLIKTVRIDSDEGIIENSKLNESEKCQSTSLIISSECSNCKILLENELAAIENARQAWSMTKTYCQKLSEIQSLKNENQQLNRINAEQQTYLADQRQKIRNLENELHDSQLENSDLKDRLQSANGQYKQIYNNFNDAENAANTWRNKYDQSQQLLIDLDKKCKENFELHLSSLKVAETFSKNYDLAAEKIMVLETKILEFEKIKVPVASTFSNNDIIIENNKVMEEEIGNQKKFKKPPYCKKPRKKISIENIFLSSFFSEMKATSMLQPYKNIDFTEFEEKISEPLTSIIRSDEEYYSHIFSNIKLVMSAENKLKVKEVSILLFKNDPNISVHVSVDKLAEIMCNSILETDADDLWILLKEQSEKCINEMLLSDAEKKFFEFTSILKSKKEWNNLFEVFSSKFGLEVLKSINQPEPSTQNICRNFRVLAAADVYDMKNRQSITKENESKKPMIVNLITLLLHNHMPSLFVPVFSYLLTINAEVILKNFLNNFNSNLTLQQKLLRLHFSDLGEYSTNLNKLFVIFFSQKQSEDFSKFLLITPTVVELTDWIICKINETKELSNGIQIQNNNKFITSKPLLESIRDCISLFAPKFKVNVDRFNLLNYCLKNLLAPLKELSQKEEKFESIKSKEGFTTKKLIKDDEIEKKKITEFPTSSAMCIANLAILTGRLITSFLTSVQLNERANYVSDLSSSIDQIFQSISLIKLIIEKYNLNNLTSANLLCYGIDQLMKFFNVFKKC